MTTFISWTPSRKQWCFFMKLKFWVKNAFWSGIKMNEGKWLVSCFCMWLSSSPSPVHWRDSSFPVAYSLLLWCKWTDRICVDLLLDPLFCSIDLYVCFYANTILFWLWLICSKVWNKKCDVTSLVLLSKDLFWLFRVFVSQILGLFVLFLWKMPLKFW